MTTLITEPELVQTAARSVTNLKSVIGEAKTAARARQPVWRQPPPMRYPRPPPRLFGGYAQEYQAP